MAAHKMRARFRQEQFQVLYDAALYAANVSNNRSLLKERKHVRDEGPHLGDRSAEYNQFSTRERFPEIASSSINGANSFTFLHTGSPADVAKHGGNQATLLQRQS
jgi:hypothetical protein